MPNTIDDAVAGAKATLAKANAKFPSPKPVATAMPKVIPPTSTPKPGISDEAKSAAAGLKARQDNVAQYMNAPKMHKGGVVPGKKGEEVPIVAEAGEKVIPTDKSEGRNSEYRKVYVARKQSRSGGGNKPVTESAEKHDSKKAEKSGQPSAKQAGGHVKP